MTVWRPAERSGSAVEPEIALILEDDMSVSAYYWRWLRAAHRAYDQRTDVSGYSVSHPDMEHSTGSVLEVPVNFTVFMYPVCTAIANVRCTCRPTGLYSFVLHFTSVACRCLRRSFDGPPHVQLL